VPLFAAETIGVRLIVFVVGYCLSIPAADAVSTLGGGDSNRTGDCPARHVNWR
jgi:hypothetical protein